MMRKTAPKDFFLVAFPESTKGLLKTYGLLKTGKMSPHHPAAVSGWWLLKEFIEKGEVSPDSPLWQWPNPDEDEFARKGQGI